MKLYKHINLVLLLIISFDFFAQKINQQLCLDSSKLKDKIIFGENAEIDRISYWDSIEVSIHALPSSIQKAQLLEEIASQFEYLGINEKEVFNLKSAIKNYLHFKKNRNVALVLKKIGTYYLSQSKFEIAQAYYQRALVVFNFHKDTLNSAACIANIGTTYYYRSNYSKAIEYKLLALNKYELISDTNAIATMLVDISANYQEQRKINEALQYCNRSLMFYNLLKNQKGILKCTRRLGTIYRDLNKLDSSLSYFNSSLIISENLKSKNDIASCFMGIGSVYGDLNQYQESIKNYNKALKILYELNDNTNIAMCLFNLGNNYFDLEKYNEAEKKLNEAIVIAQDAHNLSTLSMCHELLSSLYQRKQNIPLSYIHYKKFIALRDSIFNEENIKKTVQAEENYKFDKQTLASKLANEKVLNQISLQNEKRNSTKNIIIIAIIALLVVGCILGYVFYKNNKQKQALREFEKNELKQKLLLSQMNPHFIFNSIDHIQSLIGKKDREAISYLHKFSSLTRQILEFSRETHITLVEELSSIENYINIQQLLYNNAFDFTIHVDELIDQDYTLVPPMLTQPFIENAIKHGLYGKTEGGLISISFCLKENKLWFEIIDNGNGFGNSIKKAGHKSLAMSITKERLHYYHESSNFEILTANVLSDTNQVLGAKVSFEIPYIYEK